jgi:hypothetical protein
MPFYPVLRAIQAQTRGRVFLPNGRAVEPLPYGKTNEELLEESGIVCSKDTLPAKKQRGDVLDDVLEGEVPLYLEVTIAG